MASVCVSPHHWQSILKHQLSLQNQCPSIHDVGTPFPRAMHASTKATGFSHCVDTTCHYKTIGPAQLDVVTAGDLARREIHRGNSCYSGKLLNQGPCSVSLPVHNSVPACALGSCPSFDTIYVLDTCVRPSSTAVQNLGGTLIGHRVWLCDEANQKRRVVSEVN